MRHKFSETEHFSKFVKDMLVTKRNMELPMCEIHQIISSCQLPQPFFQSNGKLQNWCWLRTTSPPDLLNCADFEGTWHKYSSCFSSVWGSRLGSSWHQNNSRRKVVVNEDSYTTQLCGDYYNHYKQSGSLLNNQALLIFWDAASTGFLAANRLAMAQKKTSPERHLV